MELSLFPDGAGIDEDEERALIALSLVPGVGPGRIRALLARFGSPAAVMAASRRALSEAPGVGPQTADAIAGINVKEAVETQISRARKVGADLLSVGSRGFPRLLSQIYDPPALLWKRGAITEADDRAIAIVGTRRATDYGRRVAHDFAWELAREGYTIVSGLAYGIDAAAHAGALEAGGRTLAVLGSGVDRIYPSSHVRLAKAITEQGAVLSEYPLGSNPDAPNFPKRNRIISGLSLGTLVVEAYASGGALITARLALEQNREVFAIPGLIHSKAGEGSNRLIRDGHAKLVNSIGDILAELNPASVPRASASDVGSLVDLKLNDIEKKLFEALSDQPLHIDTLCLNTCVDASTALVYLLGLEFKGLVRQMAGKQFMRA